MNKSNKAKMAMQNANAQSNEEKLWPWMKKTMENISKEKIAILIILTVFVADSLMISDMCVDDKNDHSERITKATLAFQIIQTIVILTLLIYIYFSSSKVKKVVDILLFKKPFVWLSSFLYVYTVMTGVFYFVINRKAKDLKLGIVIMIFFVQVIPLHLGLLYECFRLIQT